MRLIAYLFLFISVYVNSAFAEEVKIRTIILDGKPAYLLSFGEYASEAEALSHEKQLDESIKKYDIKLEQNNDNHRFYFKIGPIRQYDQAKQAQQALSGFPFSALNTPPDFQASSKPQTIEHVEPAPAVPSNKLWNLDGADIRAVIAEVSRLTGKNFLIDPRVQGKVSIISAVPLSDQALYKVFLSMLQVSGYAAIPTQGAIKIVPNMEVKTMAPDYIDPLKQPSQGDAVMISVIPVHYVPAEQLVPVLRPLMPQWSFVSAYAPSNMLILSGRVDNIKQLTKIIKQVDSSSASGIDVVRLHHALAMDVANTLKDLVKSNAPSPGQTMMSVAVDDRNNAILISGNKTDRLRLRLIISKLDQDSPNSASNTTKVVYLHYLRATDLVPILAGVAQANFSGTVGTTIGTLTIPALDSTNPNSSIVGEASGANSTNTNAIQPMPPMPNAASSNQAATPTTTSSNTQNQGSTKPNVQIIAEPNTNSIIINAPSLIIRILQDVINQLDIRPAQLLIEAMVAEVDEDDANNLGIEWGSLSQTGKPSSFRPGFAILNSSTKLNDFQAQIYALERERKANILSTPSVVVLDNRQAKILIGQQVSVASTSYPNNAQGTTTASPYTTFNRVNVALHLYVRPQITRAGGIQLQIDQGNDTIDPTSIANTDNPVFRISSIVTSVHVQTGDVVVLGGLIEDSLGNDNTSIPVLNHIPGLGRLFQRNLRTRAKRVLMVFIRPIILRNAYDAVQITGAKYNDVRAIELDDLHSQEIFAQNNQETVLPPLHQAQLPVPFTPVIVTK